MFVFHLAEDGLSSVFFFFLRERYTYLYKFGLLVYVTGNFVFFRGKKKGNFNDAILFSLLCFLICLYFPTENLSMEMPCLVCDFLVQL